MSIHKINRIKRPYRVIFTDIDGKRKSRTFENLALAQLFQKRIKSQTKLPEDLQFSISERAEFAKIKTLCENSNKTLDEAYAVLALHFSSSVKSDITIEQAMLQVLEYKEKMGVREQTRTFYRNYSKRFEKWAKGKRLLMLSSVTEVMAQQYIDEESSKEHSKNAMRAFWTYFKKEGLVKQNVFWDIKIERKLQDKEPISFMGVKETKENLEYLPEHVRPMYALMTFAGIRPMEVINDDKGDSLKRSDIDFIRKRITVRASVSKTRKMRILEGLPDNLWLWLEPIKDKDYIYPPKFTQNSWEVLRPKVPHKIPHDALRHSFASYAYYFLGLEKAVEILGHDYAIYKKHYKGLATEADSAEYFKIFPEI